VRLLEQSHFLKISHHVADSSWTGGHDASFGNGPGSHWFAGLDIIGNNGFQNYLIALRKL
jgi:hypothetical protein